MKDDINDGFNDGVHNCTHEHTAKSRCEDFRKQIGELSTQVVAMKRADTGLIPGDDKGEYIANVTLAYRHLEDARMRLGKALQALDGGISIYDK